MYTQLILISFAIILTPRCPPLVTSAYIHTMVSVYVLLSRSQMLGRTIITTNRMEKILIEVMIILEVEVTVTVTEVVISTPRPLQPCRHHLGMPPPIPTPTLVSPTIGKHQLTYPPLQGGQL